MPLHLRLLGRPALSQGDDTLGLPPNWALLLLGFVAAHDGGVSRSQVVARFWPNESERAARHNLSQLLYRYRNEPWQAGLKVGPQSLTWAAGSDLAQLWEAAANSEWRRAAELNWGEFMAGVQAERSASVAEWLEESRSEFATLRRDAVLRHAAGLSEAGRHGEAADALRRLLSLDLLSEDVLHAYLGSALPAGRRGEALELYEAFRRQLREELDVEPLPQTERLAEALRRPEGGPAGTALGASQGSRRETPRTVPADAAAPPRHAAAERTASQHRTPFVGRDIELAELTTTLEAPACRLLTIRGPGGAGKSRIAMRLAQELAGSFAGGVHFVPLAPLSSAAYLTEAIASALGLPAGADHPFERVVERFRQAPSLLVLDNFEHLLEGAGVVDDLLAAAPELKIVVTSQAPLGLSFEQGYDLGGLSYPTAGRSDFSDAYDAVQLLLASARRANSSFMIAESDKPAILRICRLLGGLPLGLELAGAWLRLLTPTELAAELAQDLDLLGEGGADLPGRHRSLKEVFEHSWLLLEQGERRALARLAIFRGGFDVAAAREVSLAPLKTLLALSTRSLIWRAASGRFELPETLRQYVERKLLEEPEENADARRRHAAHYLSLAERAEPLLKGPEQGAWLTRLATERDNLRAALDWTEAAGDAETGLRLVAALQQFWWVRGPYDEGPARAARLLALPDAENDRVLVAKVLHRTATLVQLQGDLSAAKERYLAALEAARELGDDQLSADCLLSLGLLASVQGELTGALERFGAAADLQRKVGDLWGLSVTLNNLGLAQFYGGEYEAAIGPLTECLDAKERLGDPQGIAYALNNLGTVHLFSGNATEARRLTEASLDLKVELGDHQGTATSLANLGRLAANAGDLESAQRFLASAVERLLELENFVTMLWTLTAVVKLEGLAGRYERAVRLVGGARALATALDIGTLPAANRHELEETLQLAEMTLPRGRISALLSQGSAMPAAELASYALAGNGAGLRPFR